MRTQALRENCNYLMENRDRADLKYHLARRTDAIEKVIRLFAHNPNNLKCLDIGAADGKMLSHLHSVFHFKKPAGIDLSKELIASNKDSRLQLSRGDAQQLDFHNKAFDIVIAAAVIEHVHNPSKMISECYRVLRNGGLVIITTPNPIHDKVAVRAGYYKTEDYHNESFTITRLEALIALEGFKPIYSAHFMLSPFFRLPFETTIEKLLTSLGAGIIMSNQIVVGKKV